MRGTVGLQGPGPQTTVVFSKMLRGGASNEIGKLTGEWAFVSVTLDDVKQNTNVVSVAALLDPGGTGGTERVAEGGAREGRETSAAYRGRRGSSGDAGRRADAERGRDA